MNIIKDLGPVRIVSEGSPFDVAYDLKVEWIKDGAWELYRGFNSLSDDYANVNAREAAQRAIKELAEVKANERPTSKCDTCDCMYPCITSRSQNTVDSYWR